MARRYAIDGSKTNTNNETILALEGGTAIRPKIYEWSVSSRATPADEACGYQLERFTADGTSTSVTPQALDPGDPAATATAGENYTAEPTYTANAILYAVNVNQRATFRWVAAPGSEFIIPATSGNGIGLVAATPTSAFAVEATILFEE